jgi:hypothetical protein
MPLFWVVRETAGERSVFLQEASEKLYAWLHAALAGHRGAPVEIHELDAKTARKMPKRAIGRVLSQDEAQALLERLG